MSPSYTPSDTAPVQRMTTVGEYEVRFSLFLDEQKHLRVKAMCMGQVAIADTFEDAGTQILHAVAGELDRQGMEIRFR
ncbi:MAG: hypothetical protein KC729_00045 [Candidatus Eisenbacteria bacterium]|uniref:Uncharacterized protein n=1 Tax=Eiseniibacteriota bacterium TaxID=2212470 RepID=A0A956RMT9_UNCEI|nr:hypothetical protein [Candidatus Eisenbacteria bacterium]